MLGRPVTSLAELRETANEAARKVSWFVNLFVCVLWCRDVKTSNILLTKGGAAKVADVGLATMTDCFSSASNAHGTFLYAAPEVLMGKPSTAKVSVFCSRM
jgi:hypothetical protein